MKIIPLGILYNSLNKYKYYIAIVNRQIGTLDILKSINNCIILYLQNARIWKVY